MAKTLAPFAVALACCILAACESEQAGMSSNQSRNADQRGGGDTSRGGGDSDDDNGKGQSDSDADLDTQDSGDDEDGGNAGKQTFRYSVATVTEKVDALIVLDNSVSMNDEAQRVAAAMAAAATTSFPKKIRLGVMTTMAADPQDFTKPHRDMRPYPGMDKEPGFLSLVDKKSADAFALAALVYQNVYKANPLCDKGWFLPNERTADGKPCIAGALQNPFSPIGCEPGLLALQQMLKKNEKTSLFRAGARLAVIFISDEQSGCSSPETSTALPTADAISASAKAAGLGGITLSGIVQSGPSAYDAAITATKGKRFSIAQNANYGNIVGELLTHTKAPLPTFELDRPAASITKVTIDGQATTDFELLGDNVVKIPALESSTADVEVKITYVPK